MKETGKCSICGKYGVVWQRRNDIQKCKKCALGRDNSEV